jgi:hypothetical protein
MSGRGKGGKGLGKGGAKRHRKSMSLIKLTLYQFYVITSKESLSRQFVV